MENYTIKINYCTIILVLFSYTIVGQNYSFEEWMHSGKPAPFNWENPKHWTSSNALYEFVGHSVVKDDQISVDGNYSTLLISQSVFGEHRRAFLTSGMAEFDFLNLDFTKDHHAISVDSRPLRIHGYYHFTNSAESDSALVEISIFRQIDSTSSTLHYTQDRALPANDQLDTFSIDLEQLADFNPATDFLNVTYYTSQHELNSAPATLRLDNIEILLLSPTSNVNKTIEPAFHIAPNVLKQGETSNIIWNTNYYDDLSILNNSGRIVNTIPAFTSSIHTNDLAPGIYYITTDSYQSVQSLIVY